MRATHVLATVVITCVTLTGCSSRSHPDFALFKHVPSDRVAKVKSAIKSAGIPNLELPTEFPYPVTLANISSGEPPHRLDIFLGDSTHVIELTAMQATNNAVVSMSSVVTIDESYAKLSDGTKAIYGNNGATSQLVWDKNGVFYQLVSSNSQSHSDLTKQQLVAVASSFQ